MNRITKIAALVAVLSLALAAVALAAATKVTGGTTTITASDAAAKVLAGNHISITPVAPATASGMTFTFQITGGRLNTKTLHGVIRHSGGVTVSNGTTTVTLRRPAIVSGKRGASLLAVVRGPVLHVCRQLRARHARVRCAAVERLRLVKVARLANVTVSNGKATGTAKITAFTAHLINHLAGKSVVSAGDPLGTITVAPTLK